MLRSFLFCQVLVLSSWAQTRHDDLPLVSAGFLGGSGDDTVIAMAFSEPGDLWVVANLDAGTVPAGLVPIPLFGGGEGDLLRLAAGSGEPLAWYTLPGVLRDAESHGSRLAIAGDDGVWVLVFTASGAGEDFSVVDHAPTRIALAPDGTVASLDDTKTIRVYDPKGTPVASQTFGTFTRIYDLAIGAQRVVMTGYNQLNSNLKSPFLEAWPHDLGTRIWKAYGFTNSEVTGQNLGADSEGERLVFGSDGLLYLGGSTDGGNTVFQRDPSDITQSLPSGGDPDDVLMRSDRYSQPVQLSGSARFSFYARFDPSDGSLKKAAFLLARLTSGNHNTLRIRALQADLAGNLLIGGISFFDIEGRADRSVAGQMVGNYAGGDMFLLMMDKNFRDRVYWTPFNGTDPVGSEGRAVALSGELFTATGRWAAAGNWNQPGPGAAIVHLPHQAIPGGGDDIYLAFDSQNRESLVATWPVDIAITDLLPLFP